MKRFVSILSVFAMSLLLVSGAFAQAEFSMSGEAEYWVTYSTADVDGAESTAIEIGDGGNVKLSGKASKELDNGATVEISGSAEIKNDGISNSDPRVKYMNGPLTVTMLKASRPGVFGKGLDKNIVEAAGDPGRYEGDWVSERGISFEYAGEGMKFAATLNVHGANKIGVRPYVEMNAGPATIKGAVEYLAGFPTDTDADGPKTSDFGGGLGVELGLGSITLGASGTYGMKAGKDAAGEDILTTTKISSYTFVKMAVGAGTIGVASGYNYQEVENADNAAIGYQANLGYEQGNIIVPGLTLELGVGYGVAVDAAELDSSKAGVKVKLKYGF